jgi:iron complex outermembrane receptor protein
MANLYEAESSIWGSTPLFHGKILPDSTVAYDFTSPIVKPEKLLDMEIGGNYKTENYSFDANFYWMNYNDELVPNGTLNIFGEPKDGNAPHTLHYGIELQASAVLINNNIGKINLSANATFSKNKILDYNYITSSGEIVSLKDNPIGGFPDAMANIIVSYTKDGLYFSLTGKYASGWRTDNYGDLLITNNALINDLQTSSGYYVDNKLEPYFIFNGDISYTFKNVIEFKSIKLQLQGFNLLNRLYAAGAEGKEFYPGAERNVFMAVELGL